MLPAGLLAIAAVMAVGTGGAQAAAAPCPNADTNSAQMALPAFDSAVLCVLNQRRVENQLRPLRSNDLLADAAWIYATSMLSGQFYSHHGCLAGKDNCSTTIGRLRFLGYVRKGWAWIVGETLRGARPDTATPNSVVDEWLASPIHRVEVLKGRYREVGIGSVRGITDAFPTTEGVTVAAEFGFRHPRKKK
jgi:uncharacterized protein YkwD